MTFTKLTQTRFDCTSHLRLTIFYLSALLSNPAQRLYKFFRFITKNELGTWQSNIFINGIKVTKLMKTLNSFFQQSPGLKTFRIVKYDFSRVPIDDGPI